MISSCDVSSDLFKLIDFFHKKIIILCVKWLILYFVTADDNNTGDDLYVNFNCLLLFMVIFFKVMSPICDDTAINNELKELRQGK